MVLILGWQLEAQVSFNLSSTPGVGGNPLSVAAANINGDGKLDLISANYADNTLSVLTNDGHGGFVLASSLSVGSSPYSIVAADVNGDGKVDLISANQHGNTLSVLTNDGHGGFSLSYTYTVGLQPLSVVAADVNGDGKVDLISANGSDDTLTVLTNNGSGSFAPSGIYAVGITPVCVVATDVNGDGKLDLISANRDANTLSVLTNDGHGGFVLATTLAVGSTPWSVTTADVNGDGKVDLISANQADNTLTILTNNGNGGFVPASTLAVGSGPFSVMAADVNGDGKVDLISVNEYGNTLSVLTNATPFPPTSVPIITAQPVGQTNLVGTTAVFNVAFTASGPQLFTFQWQLAGTNLPAATNNPLILTNLTLNQAGNYDIVVSDSAGSVTSNPAILDVRFILVNINGQPAAGTMSAVAPVTVTLTGGYPGGFIFYTLDGSTPTTSSTLYSGPIFLTNPAVVSAIGLSSDFTQSNYASPVTVQLIPVYTVQTSVLGSGTIEASPTNSPYASNSVVTLTATAAVHWAFDHWTGDASGSQNPIIVTVNGPRSVQAVFTPTAYPLNVSSPGGGSVTANGLVISPGTYYPTGSVVTLVATASNGWSFVGWQGTTNSTSNPLNITISQTNNLQAIFGTVVSTSTVGGGTIVLSQPNPVPYGTVLTASAVPNPGQYFVTWSGAAGGTNTPTTITVTKTNLVINALFTAMPVGKYSLGVAVYGNGSVTISPQQNYYNPGDNVTLKAATNSGLHFFGWAGDATGTNNPLTVVMSTNKIVQAYFVGAPTVSISPLSVAVLATSNAVLNASASGFGPLAYQWQNAQGVIGGATNASFAISNAQPSDANSYSVVVTNVLGSVTSSVVTVTVLGSAPIITNQPPPLTVVISGHGASFAVTAGGWPIPAYQWQLNGSSLTGATNPTLLLSNAFPANAGTYTVVITNVFGSVTSNPALLSVTPLAITAPACLSNGEFQFSFDTAIGVDYEVDYSFNLMTWYPALTVGGNGVPLIVIDPNASGNQHRFYRIVQLLP